MKEQCPQKICDFLGEKICQNLPNSFPELYQRITYIILKFLQSKEKILFLQFPLEDLTNEETCKGKFWDEICDVIAYAIRLSMKSEELQPSQLSYPGDWYKNGDNFLLLPSEGEPYPFFFLQAVKKEGNLTKLIFKCKNSNYAPKKTVKGDLINSANSIYKLNEIPSQLQNGYDKCLQEIKLLNCGDVESKKFSSAVAICTAYTTAPPQAGKYVKPVVDIQRPNNSLPKPEVLAIVGDKAFKHIQKALSRIDPKGPTKKLIVFGTQPTVPLRESKPVTITLSFKEMHKYCELKEVKYFAPEFVEIDFPWLKDALGDLSKILNKYSDQLGDTSKHIYNYASYILASIELSKNYLDMFKEYFEKLIDTEISTAHPEICNSIKDWLDNLSYDTDSNPKQEYNREKGGTIILHRNRSIPRQLRNLENREEYGNILILDSPRHDYMGETHPISDVMRYHLFPQLHCLYYKGIETSIMDQAIRNIGKDPFFSEVGVSEGPQAEETNEVNLQNYDQEPYPRDAYSSVYGAERIDIVFNDGSSEQLSGDVLLSKNGESLKKISVTDIKEPEGKEITYYSQNNNNQKIFKSLFNNYYDFTDDKGIDYYVGLWQNALKRLIKQTEKNSLDSLCKQLNITNAVLNNHIDGKSKFMTKSKFTKVLNVLVAKGLIKEDQLNYIKNAQSFLNSNSSSFGRKLKDALYRFRINENDKSKFLQIIEKKTRYNAADLVENFLYTKTIKNIT